MKIKTNTGHAMKILMIPAGGIDKTNFPGKKDTIPRLRAGLALWQTGQFDKVLVCGGIFLPPAIQTKPAATIMKDWLRKRRVPETAIIVEAKSLDTFENASFGLHALRAAGIKNPEITVCTHWQHAIRLKMALKTLGAKVKTHGLKYPVSAATWFGEWFMIAYHFFDKKGTGSIARNNRAKRKAM
jgi:uncharacterized SAM-binding protein YcdF (DUF218 family)